MTHRDDGRVARRADVARGIDWRRVAAPSPLDRPAPLWGWNEVIEPDEVRRQVRELARGGLGGAFVHVRIGLITPYMGAAFMDAVAAALDEARALGLRLYLYDEDRWPSGWAGGAAPLRDPSFRAKWLLRVPAGTERPGDEHVSPLTRGPDGEGYDRFVSPLGQSWFSGTTYADLMDRHAMQAFLEEAYEPYAQRFGADFGGLIPAIFTDEPSVAFPPAYDDVPRGMLPWTDELAARFRAMHGYDLLPHLVELFEDVGAYPATRTDYYRTCAWLFEHHFSAQLGAWCRAHDIALTGHYLLEGSLAATLACGVCTLPHYRHMDWPGIDHLGRQVEVEPPAPTPAWTLRAVEGPFTVTTPQRLSAGDLVDQGLPFYAGRVACHARLTLLAPPDERVWLEVDRLAAPVIAVHVNGREAGTLAWRPYRLEITSLLHEGENTIALILHHSLRNLLGPHHDADGEPYWVGPHSFIGRGEGWARRLARGEQVAGWHWSYSVTEFGLLGDVRLLRSAGSEQDVL